MRNSNVTRPELRSSPMRHQEQPRRPLTTQLATVALAVAAALSLPALAQNRPPGGNDNAGPGAFVARGGFARVDPLAGVKAQINASDEEWKVIGPKLRTLAAAQQIVEADPTETIQNPVVPRGGGGGGNGAFAGPAGAGGQRGGGGPGGPGGPRGTAKSQGGSRSRPQGSHRTPDRGSATRARRTRISRIASPHRETLHDQPAQTLDSLRRCFFLRRATRPRLHRPRRHAWRRRA